MTKAWVLVAVSIVLLVSLWLPWTSTRWVHGPSSPSRIAVHPAMSADSVLLAHKWINIGRSGTDLPLIRYVLPATSILWFSAGFALIALSQYRRVLWCTAWVAAVAASGPFAYHLVAREAPGVGAFVGSAAVVIVILLPIARLRTDGLRSC